MIGAGGRAHETAYPIAIWLITNTLYVCHPLPFMIAIRPYNRAPINIAPPIDATTMAQAEAALASVVPSDMYLVSMRGPPPMCRLVVAASLILSA